MYCSTDMSPIREMTILMLISGSFLNLLQNSEDSLQNIILGFQPISIIGLYFSNGIFFVAANIWRYLFFLSPNWSCCCVDSGRWAQYLLFYWQLLYSCRSFLSCNSKWLSWALFISLRLTIFQMLFKLMGFDVYVTGLSFRPILRGLFKNVSFPC